MILALLSSLLMALSQLTPLGFLVLVGYVPLILATHRLPPGKVFKLVFAATVAQYLATLYWLTITMNVFAHLPWVVSWFALFLLTMLIACYLAGAAALARYLSIRLGWSYFALFPVTLCVTEYLRDYGFIGSFPWGASAYSLLSVPVLLQGASVGGVFGLVFYVGLVNAGIASVIVRRKMCWGALFVSVALVAYGLSRLWSYQPETQKNVKVALLQGNIEQGIKNHAPQYGDEILERYSNLQNKAVSLGAQIVIWPESSYPYRLDMQRPILNNLGTLAPVNIISALGTDAQRDFYNTAYVLDQSGTILGRFDKNYLVPFGEYVPWPFGYVVEKIVPNLGSFARSGGFKTVMADGIPLAVTICYEGVFPVIGRAFVAEGAELLINVTNDAWYGVSAGPYQHLGMYQMRSVEVGRSYARATNTGVSAWVDSRGFIHQPTNLYEEALVLAEVPLSKEITIYQQVGDIFPLSCLAILLIGLIISRRPSTKGQWAMALIGLAIILTSHGYFAGDKKAFDESAYTKDSLFIILGLLIGLRVFTDRRKK
ncbi:MAG: apolipoprotein N-acyltransferase [Myxococcota bacterium]